MATGALDSNGIWQYGEDDSNTTFSALLNRLGSSTSTQMGKALYSGRVIQTVSTFYNTGFSTSSTSMVDTGLTLTITPRFSNSKILVMVNQGGFGSYSSGSNEFLGQLVRNATVIQNLKQQISVGGQSYFSNNMVFLDSPATTSATTYKTRVSVTSAANGIFLQWPATSWATSATITLMEIAA